MPPRTRLLAVAVLAVLLWNGGAAARAQVPAPPVLTPAQARLVEQLAEMTTDAERDAAFDAAVDLATDPFRLLLTQAASAAVQAGEDERALNLNFGALRLAQRLENTVGIGNASINIGMVYGRRGDLDESLPWLRRGADIGAQTRTDALTSMALNDIGIVYRLRGDLDLSLETYQRALALAETGNDSAVIARIWNNIGNVLTQQGKYRESLEYHERSLAAKRGSGEDGSSQVNIGNIYLLQGDPASALQRYREALAINERIGRRVSLGTVKTSIGLALTELARYDEAAAMFREAQADAEAAGQRGVVADVLYDQGLLDARRGQYAAAIGFFERALVEYERMGARARVAEVLQDRANARLHLGDVAAAEADALKALPLAREAGQTVTTMHAQALLGDIDRRAGRLDAARAHYRGALDDTEELMEQVAGGELALARFLDAHLLPYQGLVETEIDARDPLAALAAAERSRARLLLETLRYGRQPVTKLMTPDEVARERELRQAVASRAARLASARASKRTTPAQLQALTEQLSTARVAVTAFEARMYAAYPTLRVYRGELEPLAGPELASLLPSPRAAAIEFAVLPTRTIVFVITRDPANATRPVVRFYSVPIMREALTRRATDFRSRIAARDLTIRQPARELYRLLLGPAQAWLSRVDTLVVLPDGPLWEVPFQALEGNDGRYLIESFTLSYAPSLAVLHEMQTVERTPQATVSERTLLAIGSSGVGSPVVKATPDAGAGALPPLVEAERQARTVGDLYAAERRTVLVGDNASARQLLVDAPQHRIVHLAAHSVLDDSSPLESYFVLSPAGAPETALLTAGVLMDLSLDADLVVLSGCETARGRIGAGEGLIGMTWAMFVAGAPSTVVSQWSVGAASTTTLMRDFHDRLRTRLGADGRVRGRAESLRSASLAMLRGGQYAHPFYWAPFVVMGDGR